MNVHFNGRYIYQADGREVDGAVIHSIATFGESLFKPSSEEVAKTIQAYNKAFCMMYKINQKDNQAKVPGILYGRYTSDVYAGGNPWPLISTVLAEVFYLTAQDFYSRDQNTLLKDIVATDKGVQEYLKLLNMQNNSGSIKDLADACVQAGDSVLNRIWKYVKNDGGRIDEQIDRNTGTQTSAKQLTWSHGNVLHVLHLRKMVMKSKNLIKIDK